MANEKKDPPQDGLDNQAQLPPDTWVFTINTKTGHVMVVAPKHEVNGTEVGAVVVNMVVLLGKLAGLITQEITPTEQTFLVENPKGRKDN